MVEAENEEHVVGWQTGRTRRLTVAILGLRSSAQKASQEAIPPRSPHAPTTLVHDEAHRLHCTTCPKAGDDVAAVDRAGTGAIEA